MGAAQRRKTITDLQQSIETLEKIVARAKKYDGKFSEELKRIQPNAKFSAKNLLAYLALRRKDIRKLQNYLGSIGVSRLARAESHVLPSIHALLHILYALRDGQKIALDPSHQVSSEGKSTIKSNAETLFGKTKKQRYVRIMVTIPTEAAQKESIITDFLKAGMNVARINCAHDNPDVWLAMIEGIRRQSKELELPCKITMDLAGPKIRTGPMKPGSKIIKLKPTRNELGEVLLPGELIVSTNPHDDGPRLVGDVDLSNATELKLRDSRGKKRVLQITPIDDHRYSLKTTRTIYLQDVSILKAYCLEEKLGKVSIEGIPSLESSLALDHGDLLKLTRTALPGGNAEYDQNGQLINHAFVSCTLPKVIDEIKVGEPVLFDDGKIGGVIREVAPDHATVEITFASPGGAKLKADKGINFPESQFSFSGLTEKDEEDLVFVAQHADMVNLSFVNDVSDLEKFFNVLDELQTPKRFGLILKIETRRGFLNLPSLLMRAMEHYPVGVMIARGDLAVECGWQQLAEVQDEIRRICEAAHIPVIWATQVLEGLAKRGLPSRAEITDVSASQRAECVMLNKGPFMTETIKTLDYILTQLQGYGIKHNRILPSLQMPPSFWVD
ncbi:MAG: pyruvate kinase [Cyclobacteriaceae bacterium]